MDKDFLLWGFIVGIFLVIFLSMRSCDQKEKHATCQRICGSTKADVSMQDYGSDKCYCWDHQSNEYKLKGIL